eukprot:IDg7560t1
MTPITTTFESSKGSNNALLRNPVSSACDHFRPESEAHKASLLSKIDAGA